MLADSKKGSSRLAPARWVLALVAVAGTIAASPAARADEARPRARSLAGDLLVASHDMGDPRFARTVIYMVRHDATGALGLVVNRPLREVPLAELLDRLGLDSAGVSGTIRLHSGGPVEPGRGFVLHTAEYSGPGTEPVKGGIAVTFQTGIFRDIAGGAGPRRALVAFGYAGWAPGQLEGEMARGSWVRATADEPLVFGEDYGEKWERAMARRQVDL